MNSNYKYDKSSEKIAFYNHTVKASDNGSYELRMFTENPPLKLFEAKQKTSNEKRLFRKYAELKY